MERQPACMSTAWYDRESGLELYRLRGSVPPFPPHFHQAYLLGVVSDGRRMLTLRGERALLEAGSVVLLCPGEWHSCAPSAGGTLDFRGIYATTRRLRHWLVTEGFSERGAIRFPHSVVQDTSLYRALFDLHGLREGDSSRQRRTALFSRAARQLLRYIQASPADEGEAVDPASRRLEAACAYMKGRLTEPLSLSQLARGAGMSKPTLHRRLAEAKGLSPRRYRESLRMEQARRCLQRGMPPVEVAQLFGYADQSHFSRRFRQLTGLTPGHYRGLYEGKGGFHAL